MPNAHSIFRGMDTKNLEDEWANHSILFFYQMYVFALPTSFLVKKTCLKISFALQKTLGFFIVLHFTRIVT